VRSVPLLSNPKPFAGFGQAVRTKHLSKSKRYIYNFFLTYSDITKDAQN
jgi:hypothetical protein